MRKLVRLRYCHEGVLDPASASIAIGKYKANSIFQPQSGGSGDHAPMGSDQWSAIYNHVTVIGSKITVRFINNGITNLVPGYAGVTLMDASASMDSFSSMAIMETRFRSSKINLPGIVAYGAGPSSTGIYTSHAKFSAKRFFGTKWLTGVSPYRGSFLSDPTEQAWYAIWCTSAGANNPGAITTMVQIDYLCLLTEPKLLPISGV